MSRLVEIRSYNLKPGTRAEFHRLVTERAMPLLERARMDVVAFGPSPHDDDSYYLIRAFDDLAHRDTSETAFYGGAPWLEGPRAAILALIENYAEFVIELDETVIDRLRARPPVPRGA
ncbi:MAG TPA: NIPSNAP family protein [Candidatus Eisenbacteria bacterium]|nr:NIPSNAP family protein [Candidatus Eisenbacteria bacterium]